MTIRSCDDPPEVPPFDAIFVAADLARNRADCYGHAFHNLRVGETYTVIRTGQYHGATFYHLEHCPERSFRADLFRIARREPC